MKITIFEIERMLKIFKLLTIVNGIYLILELHKDDEQGDLDWS